MGKKRKGGANKPSGGGDGWMATLSDLVFLLITFFVLLISMSSLDSKKLRDAFGFFDDAFDVLKYPKDTAGSNRFMGLINPLAVFTAKRLNEDEREEKDDLEEADGE